MNKEKNFISAVIYVHNAEKRIGSFLERLIDVLDETFEHSEIICVNDASSDASIETIKEVSKKAISASISLLNMSYFHGLETAMNAGVELAIGDFVFEFDNTLPDFEPDEIRKVYRKSLEGYDIVSAAPDRRQRISSRFFYSLFRKFSDLDYEMCTESFRILSRRAINRIGSMNKTVPYRKAVYANCGLKTETLWYQPISECCQNIEDRQENRYRFSLAMDSLLLFTQIGYRFSIAMTSLMIITAALMAIYSLAIYILGDPVEGWTTTVLFLSTCFFGLFGILTVIIKYLQMIVDLIFRRKRYSFESIEKITK